MIKHIAALTQQIIDAGVAIEALNAFGNVQPENLQAAAQPIIDAFDDSGEAQRARDLAAEQAAKEAAEPLLVTLRDQAQQAIAANDAFLALSNAAMTAAVVRDQVKSLTQQNTKIIKAMGRVILGKTI